MLHTRISAMILLWGRQQGWATTLYRSRWLHSSQGRGESEWKHMEMSFQSFESSLVVCSLCCYRCFFDCFPEPLWHFSVAFSPYFPFQGRLHSSKFTILLTSLYVLNWISLHNICLYKCIMISLTLPKFVAISIVYRFFFLACLAW